MTDFKPMLTVPEQITRMKEKGITFELFSEEDAAEYNDRQMKTVSYLLQTCQRFRNACAHNSCVLNDLRANSSLTSVSRIVLNRLSRTDCLSRGTIEKRMSNVRINQVITLLYTHTLLVTSVGMHSKAAVLLNGFDARMTRNLEYYSGNEMIRSSFLFLHNVIQSWFPA